MATTPTDADRVAARGGTVPSPTKGATTCGDTGTDLGVALDYIDSVLNILDWAPLSAVPTRTPLRVRRVAVARHGRPTINLGVDSSGDAEDHASAN